MLIVSAVTNAHLKKDFWFFMSVLVFLNRSDASLAAAFFLELQLINNLAIKNALVRTCNGGVHSSGETCHHQSRDLGQTDKIASPSRTFYDFRYCFTIV